MVLFSNNFEKPLMPLCASSQMRLPNYDISTAPWSCQVSWHDGELSNTVNLTFIVSVEQVSDISHHQWLPVTSSFAPYFTFLGGLAIDRTFAQFSAW